MSDAHISYTTVIEQPRTGAFGALMRWMSAHPLLAGLIGGILAVLLAMSQAFEGVQTAPTDALIISAIVVVVWVVLFFFLRGFFASQAVSRLEVRRDIDADEASFSWLENGQALVDVDQPSYELFSIALPEDLQGEHHADKAWPVWLVVTGEGGQFVMETKVTVGEARNYEAITDELLESTDETLPTGLASSLLNLAERQVG